MEKPFRTIRLNFNNLKFLVFRPLSILISNSIDPTNKKARPP